MAQRLLRGGRSGDHESTGGSTSENSVKTNFGEYPFLRGWVNKGERMHCWENTGSDEGSVPIMGTTLSVGKREVEGE